MNDKFLDFSSPNNENSKKLINVISNSKRFDDIVQIFTVEYEKFLSIAMKKLGFLNNGKYNFFEKISLFKDNFEFTKNNFFNNLIHLEQILYNCTDDENIDLYWEFKPFQIDINEKSHYEFVKFSIDLIQNWLNTDSLQYINLFIIFHLITILNDYLEKITEILVGSITHFKKFIDLQKMNPIEDCLLLSIGENLNRLYKKIEFLINLFKNPNKFLIEGLKIDSNIIQNNSDNDTEKFTLFNQKNEKIIQNYYKTESNYFIKCKEVIDVYLEIEHFIESQECINHQEKIRSLNKHFNNFLIKTILYLNDQNKIFSCELKDLLEDEKNGIIINEGFYIFKKNFEHSIGNINRQNIKELFNFLNILLKYTECLYFYLIDKIKPDENLLINFDEIPEDDYLFFFYEKSTILLEESTSILEKLNVNFQSAKTSLQERFVKKVIEPDKFNLKEDCALYEENKSDYDLILRVQNNSKCLFFLFASKEEIEKTIDSILSNNTFIEGSEKGESLNPNIFKEIKDLFNTLLVEKPKLITKIAGKSIDFYNKFFVNKHDILENFKKLQMNEGVNKDDYDKYFMMESLKSIFNVSVEELKNLLKFSIQICLEFEIHKKTNDYINQQQTKNEIEKNILCENKIFTEGNKDNEIEIDKKESKEEFNPEINSNYNPENTSKNNQINMTRRLKELNLLRSRYFKNLIFDADKDQKFKLYQEYLKIDEEYNELNDHKNQIMEKKIEEGEKTNICMKMKIEEIENELEKVKKNLKESEYMKKEDFENLNI